MVSKKQKFWTFILIIILAAAIIGGVFGISYLKGGVTFPWEITTGESKEITSEAKPKDAKTETQVVEKEQAKPKEAVKEEIAEPEEPVTEEPVEETVEEPEEVVEEEAASDGTGVTLDYYGALHVEDGALVDEDGEVARLTGVSSHGLSWYPEYVTPEAINTLKDSWGINVIRLAVYTSDYNGYCVGGEDIQTAIKDNIDPAVEAATDNEMYVIIDWHILNDADPNEYKSESIQFFGEMVRKYEDYDNVIYEICNEPNGDTTWDDVRRYANEVIPVIRNVDSDALVLVGTPEWSSDLASVLDNPLDFDNIMYTYHFYAGSHGESERDELVDAVEAGLPVFISEYGLVEADGDGSVDTDEADEWLSLLDEYQLSSCIWNLSNKAEASALIKSDCDSTSDWTVEDLSEEGTYFYNYLTGYSTDDKQVEEESEEEVVEDSKNTSSKATTDKKSSSSKTSSSKSKKTKSNNN